MTIERPAERADKAAGAMWSNAGGYPHPRRVIPIRKTADNTKRPAKAGLFAKSNAVESQHNIIVVTVSLSNARPT
ncbi:hypothetical protein [uncultured Bifidobacterium sp.]|uniref:hypothetical protein n=1 Tax=uncultured Bifidobacterium sp. TaxID=165187 RepID=UPI0025866607|nr:hypothetical protein [uncultured Bifidobacterium sp.]